MEQATPMRKRTAEGMTSALFADAAGHTSRTGQRPVPPLRHHQQATGATGLWPVRVCWLSCSHLARAAVGAGSRTCFADTGPDAAGNEAGHVLTLDVGSGQRRQVTQLPPGVSPAGPAPHGVVGPAFIDNQTIGFYAFANPDRLNPGATALRSR